MTLPPSELQQDHVPSAPELGPATPSPMSQPPGTRAASPARPRMAVTFVANVIRSVLSLGAGIVVARGLGAGAYGDLNFLMGSFVAIAQLTDMGTSAAFFTFLSQRPRGRSFLQLFAGWLVLQFLVTTLIVGLILPESVIKPIWLGHSRGIVFLAFAANFFMAQAWNAVTQIGEASRRTALVQVAGIIPVTAHLLLVTIAAWMDRLTVSFILWLLIVEYAISALALTPRLLRHSVKSSPAEEPWRDTVRAFFRYCRPLVLYTWMGFAYNFADRWLLQFFGGPKQQGYFSVGQQFAAISLLATTSVLRVFWKEVAEARQQNDHARTRRLYESASRGLFFLAAWVSCMLIPFSRDILLWTVGPSYQVAWLAFACLLVYPIYQTIGQLQGVFFYASSDTGYYAKVGLVIMALSLPLTYIMLAPRTAAIRGLGLGALGVALKMLVVQIVGVNLQAYVISKRNGWRMDGYHQALVLAGLFSLGWLCKFAAAAMVGMADLRDGTIVAFVTSCVLYGAASLAMLAWVPSMGGLERDDLKRIVSVGIPWIGSSR